jgi:flagellar biosynthesis protein FliP
MTQGSFLDVMRHALSLTLLLFIMVDGWYLIVRSLVTSFNT